MQEIIHVIKVNNQQFQAVNTEYDYSCNGCAFVQDRELCHAANKIFSCSGDKGEFIFKSHNGLITKQMQETNNQDKQDSIVSEIRELLLKRSQTGINKYGTTLDRKDLKPSEWCQHLLEELLDASGYVLRLKKDLEVIESITGDKK